MTDYKPGRRGKAHIVIPVILCAAGTCALAGSLDSRVFAPVMLQLIGLAALAAAAAFVFRFSASAYLYVLGDGAPGLLCVYRTAGNRKTAVVSADLKNAVSAELVGAGRLPKKKVARRVNCCLNVFPDSRAIIVFRTGNGTAELVVETDERFFGEIKKLMV